MRQATAKQAQRTPITIGSELAAKMFNGRTGHGNSQRICERHLSPVQLAAFAALAVERGMQHQQATIAALVAALRETMNQLQTLRDEVRGDRRMTNERTNLISAALRQGGAALAAVEEAQRMTGYIIAPHRMAGWQVIDLSTQRPKVGHWYGDKESAEAARDVLNAKLAAAEAL